MAGAAFLSASGLLSPTSLVQWSGQTIPERVLEFIRSHPPIRGDEVLTAGVLGPLMQRSPHCRVIELVQLDPSVANSSGNAPTQAHGIAVTTVGAAICLDHADDGGVCTVETVGPHDARIHHALLDAVLSTGHQDHHGLRWRPPSSDVDDLELPPNAHVERTVVEMRATLPLVGRLGRAPTTVEVLSLGQYFRRDPTAESEQQFSLALMHLNNRAFRNHPEQGCWTTDDVLHLLCEPWFDFDSTVVALREGTLVGFAVMKAVTNRPIELYVVAGDPSIPTPGLGRALVVDGYRRASSRHASKEAMLFVDSANSRAVGLYESLGFATHRTQRVVAVHHRHQTSALPLRDSEPDV